MKLSVRLSAQEQRHGRDMAAAKREKLLLHVQTEVVELKELPRLRPKKDG